jgi:uncharacterized Tic20 family protein
MVNEETANPYQTPEPEFGEESMTATSDERTWALFAHLSAFSTLVGVPGFVGPLVIWLMKKDESPFVEDQAKESLNFQITMFLAGVVAALLCLVFIGFLMLPVVFLLDIILPIFGAIAANKGEAYRYPFCVRLIA